MNDQFLDLPAPIDTLKEEDYPSRAAWLEACADLAVKRSSPAFQKAYAEAHAKVQEREQKDFLARVEAEAQRKAVEVILPESTDRQLKERATQEVAAKVRRGEIEPARMADAITTLYSQYAHTERQAQARRDLVNQAMRAAAGYPQEEK